MAVRTPAVVQTATAHLDDPTGATGQIDVTFSNPVGLGNTVLLGLTQRNATQTNYTYPNGFYQLEIRGTPATSYFTEWRAAHNIRYSPTTYRIYYATSNTVIVEAYELSNCDYAYGLEDANGTSTAPNSGGASGIPFSVGLLIATVTHGDLTPGTSSSPSSGYTADLSVSETQFNTGTPPVAQNTFVMDTFTSSITDVATDPTFSCTLSNSDRWVAMVIYCVRLGRVFVTGAEPNATTNWTESGTGTFAANATFKRTGSSGSLGWSIKATAQNKSATVQPALNSQDHYLHTYINVQTAPASTQPIFWFGKQVGAPSGVALWYNQATASFALRMYTTAGGGATNTQVQTQDGAGAISAATWYRVEWHFFIDSSKVANVDWWVDGVLQTSIAQSTPSSAGEVVQPGNVLGFGNTGSGSTATFEYWMDDFVMVSDHRYQVNHAMPLGAVSVIGLVCDGVGTDNVNADFQDNASGAWSVADIGKVNDTLPGTADYCKQVTADKTAYIELTNGNPASTQRGGGTIWWGRTTSQSDGRILIGGDEYQTLGLVTLATGVAPGGAVKTPVGMFDGIADAGTEYTDADVNAMLLRWGYSNNVATPPRLNTYMIEIVGLPVLAGGDQWGWEEGQDSWGMVIMS
jgi:hypothetical protein